MKDLGRKPLDLPIFTLVTSLFILFADLMPKRLAMIAPEKLQLV